MKKIMVTLGANEPVHSAWRNFLATPPKGFSYITSDNTPFTFAAKPARRRALDRLIAILYDLKKSLPSIAHCYSVHNAKRLSKKLDASAPDLIYCTNGKLYYGNKPWVVDFENPTAFFAHSGPAMRRYKDEVRELFLRDACKGIIAYSNIGREGFLEIFGKDLARKVHVAPNVVARNHVRPIRHENFTMLFTGSSNIHDNFYARGGREVVHAFLKVAKKYPEVKLIMRCNVPKQEQRLLENKNVEIYDAPLSPQEFNALFARSDIFLFPAYVGYALTNLEAMSYGLPIITSDLMENGEYVEDGKTGFVVTAPKIPYYEKFIPQYYVTDHFTYPFSDEYVDRIVARIEQLYKNPTLRKRMGANARAQVTLHHSIAAKNAILAKIFKYAT